MSSPFLWCAVTLEKSLAASPGFPDIEYIEPTAQSRRRLMLAWIIALVVGTATIKLLEVYLDRLKALPLCDQVVQFRWLWAMALLGLAGVGVFAARLAQRSLQLNQWPLPGTWVFHRTPIRRGSVVKWRAYAMLAWSMFVIVGSAASWSIGESYVSRVQSQRCPGA